MLLASSAFSVLVEAAPASRVGGRPSFATSASVAAVLDCVLACALGCAIAWDVPIELTAIWEQSAGPPNGLVESH